MKPYKHCIEELRYERATRLIKRMKLNREIKAINLKIARLVEKNETKKIKEKAKTDRQKRINIRNKE